MSKKTEFPKTGIEKFDTYTEGVASGEIEVCKWVRLAVERHYRDMERQWDADFPYYFDRGACEHYVNVFETEFQHYEGVVAGQPVVFEPWQWFAFGSAFGWLKKELFHGFAIRRFRRIIIIIPKKNGKSLVSGGTGIYLMDFDGWPGAQCYIMAKSEIHARDLGYRAATSFVEKNERLKNKYKLLNAAGRVGIYFEANNNSFFKTITPKADSQDGRNVHGFLPDEVKDWDMYSGAEVYELMVNGTVNAPNSMIMETTTAGPNTESLGYESQQYLEKVLEGSIVDETVGGVIYTIDEEDMYAVDELGELIRENGKPVKDEFYYENPRLWKKANPNFGVSVYEETLKEMLAACRDSVSKRIAFCTKHLNQWFTNTSAFIKPEIWNACNIETSLPLFSGFTTISGVDKEDREEQINSLYTRFFERFKGMRAWAGLDLGSVDDFTSFVLAIEDVDMGVFHVVPQFWIPDDTLKERKNAHLIKPWIKQGYIQTTPGATTDHNFLEYCILKTAEYLDLQELYFDRTKADAIMNNLDDAGLECVKFGQGYVSMNPAVDAFEKLALEKRLSFGDGPVLRWMNSNTVIRMDPAGNRKFDKDKSHDKIDGIVAGAMAIFNAYLNTGEGESIYNKRGAVGF